MEATLGGRGVIPALVAMMLCMAGSAGATAAELERFEFTRVRMGIPFNITVYADSEAVAIGATDAAYTRIRELNDIFSDYHPESETNRLVKNALPGKPFPVSRDLAEVLSRARDISEASEGAFDLTVSPVVKLWRRAWRTKVRPTDAELAAARERVGFENVQIDRERSTVTLARGDLQLDFGAIAKGYACDEALAVLKKRGLTRALVEAGGDLACGDPPPGQPGWRIGIESPAGKGEPSGEMLLLKNCGVASSGDAYQFIEFDGVRYSHIVDPKTGLGLTTRSFVTMIARDGTLADALASAASVLGPDKGRSLIESIDGAEMRMVTIGNGEEPARVVETPGFAQFLDVAK